MSQHIGPSLTICNAANADVAAANASWYDAKYADKLVFNITITGTANATLDFDFSGNNVASNSQTFNNSNQLVLDDPCKQVRAYSNNVGANEAVLVEMQRIYFNRR